MAGEIGGDSDGGDIWGEMGNSIRVDVGDAETEWQNRQQWFEEFRYFLSAAAADCGESAEEGGRRRS